jgi:hypothetical protein
MDIVNGLTREEFRRLTLRSATGWSQRDQPYHDYLKTRLTFDRRDLFVGHGLLLFLVSGVGLDLFLRGLLLICFW